MIVDLQVNLETEDGSLVDPEALILAAKEAGLDGLLVTQKRTPEPDLTAYRKIAAEAGIQIFSGIKLVTNRGWILAVLPSDKQLPSEITGPDDGVVCAHQVVEQIKAVGGVSIALRPYGRDVVPLMGDHLFSFEGLTACEVMAGSLNEIANDLALEAASNLEIPCIGTSGASGNQGLGTAATLLRRTVKTEDELVDIIRSGDCWPVGFRMDVPYVEPLQHTHVQSKDHYQRDGKPRRRQTGYSNPRMRRRDNGEHNPRMNDDHHHQDHHPHGHSHGPGHHHNNRPPMRQNDFRQQVQNNRHDPRGRRPRRPGSTPPRGVGSERRGRDGGGGGRHYENGGGGGMPEDYGNRVRPRREVFSSLPDDIGNRLGPGETSPFHRAVRNSDD